jgi:sulfite exporter TauE/SafE
VACCWYASWVANYFALGEALALGLASGPACLAACGPVLVPWLITERNGVRPIMQSLTLFLGGRLVGYLVFAAVAWQLGAMVSLPAGVRLAMTSAVDVLLGLMLLWYAWSGGFAKRHACAGPKLVTIGAARDRRTRGPAVFGLLTGLNLCPPFVAAAIRAAETGSLVQAMLFFAAFFAGTSVWFLPLAGMGCVARNESVMLVGRITMALVAVFYFATGAALWIGGAKHV